LLLLLLLLLFHLFCFNKSQHWSVLRNVRAASFLRHSVSRKQKTSAEIVCYQSPQLQCRMYLLCCDSGGRGRSCLESCLMLQPSPTSSVIWCTSSGLWCLHYWQQCWSGCLLHTPAAQAFLRYLIASSSLIQGSHASLKVLESAGFFLSEFKALKVLQNKAGAWKYLNFMP